MPRVHDAEVDALLVRHRDETVGPARLETSAAAEEDQVRAGAGATDAGTPLRQPAKVSTGMVSAAWLAGTAVR